MRGDDGCGHMGDGRNRHGGGRGTIHIGGRDLAARDFYQWIMHLPIAPFKAKHAYIYRIKYVCTAEGEENERIKELFGVRGFNRINYYTVEENVHAAAEISTNHSISDEVIKGIIFGNEFVTSVERIFQYDGKE